MGTKFFVLFLAILLHDALGNLAEISYNPRFRNVNKKFLKAEPIEFEDDKTMIDTQSQNIPTGGFVIVSTPLDTPSRKQHFADSIVLFQQYSAAAQFEPFKPNEKFDIPLKEINKKNNLPIVLQLLGYTGNPPQVLALPQKPTKTPVMVNSNPDDVMMLIKPESDATLAKPSEKPVEIVAPSVVEDVTEMKQEISTSNKPVDLEVMLVKVPEKLEPVETEGSVSKPEIVSSPNSEISKPTQKPVEILTLAVNDEISTSSKPIIQEAIQNEQTDTEKLSSVQEIKKTVVAPVMLEVISEAVPVMNKPSKPLSEKILVEDKKEEILINSSLNENAEKKPSMEKVLEESSTMLDMAAAKLPVIQKPMTNIVVEVLQEQLAPKADENADKVQKSDDEVKVASVVMEKVQENLSVNADSSTVSKKQIDLNNEIKASLEAKLKEIIMNSKPTKKIPEKQQMADAGVSAQQDEQIISSEQKPMEDEKKTTVAITAEKENSSADNTASNDQKELPSAVKLDEETIKTLLEKAVILDLNKKPMQKQKEAEVQKMEVVLPASEQIKQDLMKESNPVESLEKEFLQAMQMDVLSEMPSQDSSMLSRKKKPKPGRKPKPNKKPTKKPNITLTQINTTTKKPVPSSSPAPTEETSDSRKPVESSSAVSPDTSDS